MSGYSNTYRLDRNDKDGEITSIVKDLSDLSYFLKRFFFSRKDRDILCKNTPQETKMAYILL